jgi:hypothetical protein
MYTPSAIKVLSIVAMVLTLCGICFSIFAGIRFGGIYYVAILSWALLFWASLIGFQLSSYKLYEEEYKKVSIRVMLIIVAFIIAMLTGLLIGIILAVVLLSTLWALKKNYDEWDSNNSEIPQENIGE